MSRGRGLGQLNNWDPMKDDFNDTTYDPQYPDNDARDGTSLDHSRLYVRNIPMGLNEEGLRSAFSKFGTLVELFLSGDKQRRFGLVGFETSGEAKAAMMKLNNTEPLKLNITLAHKRKPKETNRNNNRNRDRDGRFRDERDENRPNRGYERDSDSRRQDYGLDDASATSEQSRNSSKLWL